MGRPYSLTHEALCSSAHVHPSIRSCAFTSAPKKENVVSGWKSEASFSRLLSASLANFIGSSMVLPPTREEQVEKWLRLNGNDWKDDNGLFSKSPVLIHPLPHVEAIIS